MTVRKDLTLDGAAMILISLGIGALQAGETWTGVSIVVLGLGVIAVKYFTRELPI